MRLARGADAETQALRALCKAGLTLVTRNWRCRHGELDLVMRDREVLVFVEVRARRRSDFGGAAASVDKRKRQRLAAAAGAFLAAHPQHAALPARFDVVAFERDQAPQWLRGAFTVED
ncbi:MAG: YraN family protein [Gammaproteobacteria bacterium]|nr:YraN family protein [Gammaproteobacteria bacterium]